MIKDDHAPGTPPAYYIPDQIMIAALRRLGYTCKQIGNLIGLSESAVYRAACGQIQQLKACPHAALHAVYMGAVSGKGGQHDASCADR